LSTLLFSIIFVLFTALMLFLAVRGVALDIKKGGPFKWILGTLGFLVIVGIVGFFGPWFFGLGILQLPNSFQWPVGYAIGVMRTPDGKYVVPLVPSGRVQLYDSQWRFLRGWQIDAHAGDIKVKCPANGTIEVFTARGLHHYSFTQDGNLVSSQILPTDTEYSSLHTEGTSVVVPTSPLLWVFSSPLLSWGVGALGGIGLTFAKKRAGMKPE
jgi:hypothetical protein